jgi:hypothetical protein
MLESSDFRITVMPLNFPEGDNHHVETPIAPARPTARDNTTPQLLWQNIMLVLWRTPNRRRCQLQMCFRHFIRHAGNPLIQ